MKIRVGDEVEFIGTEYGGCEGDPCKECFIKDAGDRLVVEKINTGDEDSFNEGFGNRTIKIRHFDFEGETTNSCIVDERDLKVIKAKKITNWRQRIK